MRVRPTRWEVLVDELAGRIVRDFPDRSCRVLLDGPPPARPGSLAESLAVELRRRGRPALAVAAGDFLRPASVRLEFGRRDPDEFLDRWLDEGALRREVLAGNGQVLPRLWDVATDRAYRDERVSLGDGGVVLVSGALLLGRGLPAELTVHLRMSAAALARRLPAEEHWTLPAYIRYAGERRAEGADVTILTDHPDSPALLESP
ncbi:hypothetical protein GCM10023321_00180 [Pseudonocardia eucalypti]|uniref:Uridine kinase n=1 Tax=Pseudonocardia eucalypti TaxID=648755 RepID=A0ABP9PC61_9PSEU|nr:hypothetical protein [Pseudonocardia eucalypti]